MGTHIPGLTELTQPSTVEEAWVAANALVSGSACTCFPRLRPQAEHRDKVVRP